MKSVLISIKPKYCELIAKGRKTIELRKTKPNLKPPFKCYIYMTKSNLVGDRKAYKDRMAGKVIGEFICDEILCFPYIEGEEPGEYCYNIPTVIGEQTCLHYGDAANYGSGKNLYFWHISNLVIYDKPKELDDFIKSNIPSFENLKENNIQTLCENCYRTNFGERADCVLTQFYNSYECDMGDCEKAYENYIFDNYSLKCPPQSWCYVEER